MGYSIYHFFADLCQKKELLSTVEKLDSFPFDERMLSCNNKGRFPDLAIKLNHNNSIFSGGELIELKDSNSYTVSSFNSTIPTGEKDISELTSGNKNTIRTQMQEAGDDILSLLTRPVFYLVRGRKHGNVKVCLTQGQFFETILVSKLISQSFAQALEERLDELGESLSAEMRMKLLDLFSEQQTFSKVRTVDKASVKLRFRIMTEVNAEANILNTNQYPQLYDNTLNFAVPCQSDIVQKQHRNKMRIAFEEMNCSKLFSRTTGFILRHHFNGDFLIFQVKLHDTN